MLPIPLELFVTINVVLLILSFILAMVLISKGVSYVRDIGDSEKQEGQKKTILTLIIILLFISLAAAVFNVLIGSV